ncbi:MAG TPA: TetR/AcrR family transcriptional regulator [Solirubrobacterales bacterium]|nr:TetR/AcrR family transcriptional regulator [Solirubrobacterales bacterium]
MPVPSAEDHSHPELSSEQQRRLKTALTDLAFELGYDEVTLERVCERAAVPRELVERSFGDLGTLSGWTHLQNAREFDEMVKAAYERESTWRDSLRAAAYAAARFIEDRPRRVQFAITALFRAGPMAQVVREEQLEYMVDMIDQGRQELDDPESMDRSVAEGVMGAIYGKLTSEVQLHEGQVKASDFVADMMYVAVRPYLGEEAAREELRRGPADRAGYARGEF